MELFTFTQILILSSVSKQWRPRSDAAFCLGLHCLSMCHKNNVMLIWVKWKAMVKVYVHVEVLEQIAP